jgi:hypothetical protein
LGTERRDWKRGTCYILPAYLIRIEEYPCQYYVRVVELSVSIPRDITAGELSPFVDMLNIGWVPGCESY